MKIFMVALLALNSLVFADLGTDPVSYSCDEMYYEFYYDYEKLRALWKKFDSPTSSCNKAAIEWLKNDSDHPRNSLGYSLLDKDALIQKLVEFNILPENNGDIASLNLNQAGLGLPLLMTQAELNEKIEQQKQIRGSYLNRTTGKWSTPIVGKGAANVSPYGYYRIDHIGMPLDLEQSKNLRCSDMYRGFGSCEQDCVYMRTILIDMHAKIKLFTKDWEWENDKMICSTQDAIKQAMIPFDAAYCKESCPGSNVPCNTCTFKSSKYKKPRAITCLSEEDAKHAANLYCYLNGQKEGCEELQCNTIYNIPVSEDHVISAKNEYRTHETTEVSLGGQVEAKARAGVVAGGIKGNIDVVAKLKSGFQLYTYEGATSNKRYFTKRNDGKLFECNENMYKSGQNIKCEDLDELNFYPHAHTSCNDKYRSFSKCEEYDMGDGRAFFDCTSEVMSARVIGGEAFAGVDVDLMIPVVGGTEVKIYGNSKFGWDVGESIMATSKKFNAGGLEVEHMQQTCKRWTDQWFNVSVQNNPNKKWQANLIPQALFQSKELDLKPAQRLRCSILDEKGSYKRIELDKLSAKLGYLNVDEEFKTKNGLKKRKKKEKVTLVSYVIKDIEDVTWNASIDLYRSLRDWIKSDNYYPPKSAPEPNFVIPFENEHLEFVTQFQAGNNDSKLVLKFLNLIGEQKTKQFEIKDCRYEPMSEKELKNFSLKMQMMRAPYYSF